MKRVEAFIQPHRLSKVAHTHNPGDGLVNVSDVSQVLRIADAHTNAGESQ